MKIVINVCYGGFSLSFEAMKLARKKGANWAIKHPIYKDEASEDYQRRLIDDDFFYPDVERNDPILVEVVEELKEKANGDRSSGTDLKVVEIPDNVDWEIT